MTDACIQCGHDASDHWPDHGKPTSACGVCIEPPMFYTQRLRSDGFPDGSPFMCCWPAQDIRRSA